MLTLRNIFVLAIINLVLSLHTHGNGLRIKGNKYPIEQRTSLSLNERFNTLKSNFTLNFEAKLLEESNFGTIFRLKFKNPDIAYNLLFRQIDNNTIEFKINEEGQSNLATLHLNRQRLLENQWFYITLNVNLVDKSIQLTLLDKKVSATLKKLNNQPEIENIYFGKSDYIVDVADFAIRNIELQLDNRKLNIPLNESSGNKIHMSDGNVIGSVENPEWLINDSYFWKKKKDFRLTTIGGYQFDNKNNRIIIYNQETIQFYNIHTGKLITHKYATPFPLTIQLGNSFILDNKLYVYEVNNLPKKWCKIACVDLITFNVECITKEQLQMQLHHHTGIVYDQSYVIFGGFGNERYSNSFIKFDFEKAKWDTLAVSGDRISPRYFVSSFFNTSNRSMYVFGGMGNEAGDHTIGRKYFYDLYQFDLRSFRLKKIWEIELKNKSIVPVKNIIFDQQNSFYTLMYSEYLSDATLQLYRFNMLTGKHDLLGNGIPMKSEKIKTNANIYYSENFNSFYAITEIFDNEEKTSTIHIYELKSPAVAYADLQLYSSHFLEEYSFVIYVILLLIIVAIGVIIQKILFQRKTKKYATERSPNTIDKQEAFHFPTKNAIYLFGEFIAIDKHGKDITYLFSHRLKQMILLFIASNAKKGLKASDISEALWPDKDISSSKNIRGVTINQLRKLLTEFNGIDLIYENNFYRLQISEFYIDYSRFNMLIKESIFNEELRAILKRGMFLKGIDESTFDQIKNNVAYQSQALLEKMMLQYYQSKEYDNSLDVAKIYLQLDPTSVSALKIELKSLNHLGQRVEARKSYERFQRRYVDWVNEEFPLSFEQVCQ